MSSLLTNTSAMTALTTLKSIAGQLDKTSSRISTGLKVNDASDNAAYWSIATTIRADNGSLGAVKDALGLGAASVDTAFNGMNRSIELMKDIQAKLTAAMSPNVDRAKIQTEIDAKLKELKQTSEASVVSGENWLSTDSSAGNYVSDRKVVASFTRIDGNITVDTVTISVNDTKLYDKTTTAATAGTDAAKGAIVTTWETAQDTYEAAKVTFEKSAKDAAAITALETAKTTYETAKTTFETDRKTANDGVTAGTDGEGGILNKS
ncbi:flagellin N-terminal helical domain-containing protein, partial [Microvirga rosea]|nr:flagellin [Microvirga rosea]